MRADLSFFLDRGVGSRSIATGLREAGWRITTMDDRYGAERSQSVTDVEWIRDAASRGEILICKDRRMAKRPLEAESIYYAEARVLVLASAQITGPEMREWLLTNGSAIERLAGVNGPWVFAVYASRIARIRLNHP